MAASRRIWSLLRVQSATTPWNVAAASVVGDSTLSSWDLDRVCREGLPLWLVLLGGVDKAKAAASRGNVVSRLLPRSGGASLRRRRWSHGVLSWRSGLELLRLGQVMLLLVSYFFKGTEHALGLVGGGRLDLSQPFLGGDGGRHWRAQIQELEEAGRGSGRWATADGFFNFDSSQSQRAMGLLQLKGVLVFLSGGGGRWRGGRPEEVCGRSRGINVNFVLFVSFAKFGWRSCSCILSIHACIRISSCMFF